MTNSTLIPNEAIVTSITTSGTQSPKQGNTHHMIRPASADDWFTSTVAASASSGSYIIALNDNFAAKQVWNFKYNAVAGAKSTMSNIKVTIKWQYDMKDTEYKIFTN